MNDKAAGQKTRSPEGCDENGSAVALLLSHVTIQICSFGAPCRRPILIATPLPQSLTWCTSYMVELPRRRRELFSTDGRCGAGRAGRPGGLDLSLDGRCNQIDLS